MPMPPPRPRTGPWVDRLTRVGRTWTTIFRGSRSDALRVAPNIYAARRRRDLSVEIRRAGGLIEARRV